MMIIHRCVCLTIYTVSVNDEHVHEQYIIQFITFSTSYRKSLYDEKGELYKMLICELTLNTKTHIQILSD